MFDRIDAVLHDTAYAVRQIRRAPAVALTIVATFALGVGANATMFGLLDRLLLRGPTHVSAPDRLVRVQVRVKRAKLDYNAPSFSYPGYLTVQNHIPGFSSVAMQTSPNPLSYGLGASAHPIQYILVSGNYFATL